MQRDKEGLIPVSAKIGLTKQGAGALRSGADSLENR